MTKDAARVDEVARGRLSAAVSARACPPQPESLPAFDRDWGAPVGGWSRPSWATASTSDPTEPRIYHERRGEPVRPWDHLDRELVAVLRVDDDPCVSGGEIVVARSEPVVDVEDTDGEFVITGLPIDAARRLAHGLLELVRLAEREQRAGEATAA